MKSINASVTPEDRMDAEELSQAVLLYQKAKTDEERNQLFTAIWMAIKQYVISVLSTKYNSFYTNYSEEMLHIASIAVFECLDGYDYEKGRVTTYLRPTILHAGQSFINEYISGTTAHYGACRNKIIKATNELMAMQIKPTPFALADKTKLPLQTIRQTLEQMSFSDTVHIEANPAMLEGIEDELGEESSPESIFLQNEERAAISRAINMLPKETREVVLLKFGFKTNEYLPDVKVAEQLNMNRNQVRRHLNQATRTLKAAFTREKVFESQIIREEIRSQKISFVPKTSQEEIEDARLFMEMNDIGF